MRPSRVETSEPACVKRNMLSMNSSVSPPSSSRKYSATVSPVNATRRRDQGGLRFIKLFQVDDTGLLKLQPKIVALARTFSDSCKHGKSAVLGGNVVDEFLNDDGLADAGSAEQTSFATLQKGLDQIDDLDAGLKHLLMRRLFIERWH